MKQKCDTKKPPKLKLVCRIYIPPWWHGNDTSRGTYQARGDIRPGYITAEAWYIEEAQK